MAEGPNMMELFKDLKAELRSDIRELRDRLLSAVEAMAALQATIEATNHVELIRQLESRVEEKLKTLENRCDTRITAAMDRLQTIEDEHKAREKKEARKEGIQRGYAAGLGALGGTVTGPLFYAIYRVFLAVSGVDDGGGGPP